MRAAFQPDRCSFTGASLTRGSFARFDYENEDEDEDEDDFAGEHLSAHFV